MADFSRPRYEATVITTAFQITGQIEPIGPWLDFLNAKDKITLPVYNAHLLAIGTSVGPAPEKPQVFVNRHDICFIYLPDRNSHQTVHMLRNVQTAIAHIGPVICRGEWHMGMDATLATFIDDLPGNFFPDHQRRSARQGHPACAAAPQGRIDPGQSPARAGLSSGVEALPSRRHAEPPGGFFSATISVTVLAPIVSVSIRAGIPTRSKIESSSSNFASRCPVSRYSHSISTLARLAPDQLRAEHHDQPAALVRHALHLAQCCQIGDVVRGNVDTTESNSPDRKGSACTRHCTCGAFTPACRMLRCAMRIICGERSIPIGRRPDRASAISRCPGPWPISSTRGPRTRSSAVRPHACHCPSDTSHATASYVKAN